MFCQNCGSMIDNDSTFCKVCGSKTPIPFAVPLSSVPHAPAPTIAQSANMQWYYIYNNEKRGPVSELEIEDLVRRGVIGRSTSVWNSSSQDWVIAGNTHLATLMTGSQTSLTQAKTISDKWIWLLATIPVSVNILVRLFASLQYPIILTILAVILNVVFITLDEEELKKAGIDSEKWMWLGIILVPVYLFVRESNTNKNYTPGSIWIFLFIVAMLI